VNYKKGNFIVETKKSNVYELAENISSIEVKNNFLDFIEFCKSLKMTPRLYASEKMNIKFRGKMILRFDPSCLNGNLYIFFTVGYFHEMENLLSNQPSDVARFYIKNIRLCSREECIKCQPIPKRILNISGTECELCFTEMFFINPTKEQFEYIKRFVKIRREHIKATSK
jgi:hypothetical protein